MSKQQKPQKEEPMIEGLGQMLQAIERQIAREMQRSPDELERLGVQKWDPFLERIEKIAAAAVEKLGGGQVGLDSLIVASQALATALQLVVEELGREGLGELRTGYCLWASDNLDRSILRMRQSLSEGGHLN